MSQSDTRNGAESGVLDVGLQRLLLMSPNLQQREYAAEKLTPRCTRTSDPQLYRARPPPLIGIDVNADAEEQKD